MSSYDLQPEDLAYCSIYWDTQKKQFLRNDPYDKAQCCLATCKDMIDFCYSGNSSSTEKCSLAVIDCENHCNKAIQSQFSKMTDCVALNNCGTFPIIDTECITKNKDTIISCCKENLSQKSCDILYEKILQGDKSSLWPLKEVKQDNITDHTDNTHIKFYIFCFLVGILTIIFLNKYFY